MKKHIRRIISLVLCLMLMLSQFPAYAAAHSESGFRLENSKGTLSLKENGKELYRWEAGSDPDLTITTLGKTFSIVLKLEQPYLLLFDGIAPNPLELCGSFRRVTVDGGLKTALKLVADEHSSISHMELLSPILLTNAGTVSKYSAVRGSTCKGDSPVPENSLRDGEAISRLNSSASQLLQDARTAVKNHESGTGRDYVIVIGSGGAKAADKAALDRLLAAECGKAGHRLLDDPCGHVYCGYRCCSWFWYRWYCWYLLTYYRPCGHFVCAGDHGAAACGTEGHFVCAGDHSAAACGTVGHFVCAGDHGAAACGTVGHFVCAGDHGAAPCGTEGHFVCAGDHSAAACGTEGHFNCNGDHSALPCGHYACDGGDHTQCVSQMNAAPRKIVTPPTEPVTPPAEPVTPPTEPVTPPAEPVTPPTEPVTPPTEPVTPPTEPVTPPTDPVTPPADPVTPPADPVTPPAPPVTPPAPPEPPPAPPVTPPTLPTE